MRAEARVVHRLPGRLRLRFPAQKQDITFFQAIVAELRDCPGVSEIRANPGSGSVLVLHTSSEEAILRYASERQLFAVGSEHAAASSVQAQVEEGVQGLRQALQTISGREVDLNGLVVAGLAALAVQQVLQGNVMAPAISLLWYAYSAAGFLPGGRDKDSGNEGDGEPPKASRLGLRSLDTGRAVAKETEVD